MMPMASSATGNESVGDIKSSFGVGNGTVHKELPVQVAGNNSGQPKSAVPQSRVVDESEPALPTGWLLAMALLGFVMFSNRSGV